MLLFFHFNVLHRYERFGTKFQTSMSIFGSGIKPQGPSIGNSKTIENRKNLRPQDVVAIVDSREQTPLDLSPLSHIVKGLPTADYSVVGAENLIAFERKSLNDLIGCIGHGRSRFERMLDRLREYPYRAIVVEADWSSIDLKSYRGTLHPNAVYGTLMGWAMSCNVPIMFMGDRKRAGLAMARLIWVAANRIHRQK